jgi:hypothetical protein
MSRDISRLVILGERTRVGEIELASPEINLSLYDAVCDETQEFPDHTEILIAFYRDGQCVRRLWNPSCDITYKEVLV